jgi:hypothetical protein
MRPDLDAAHHTRASRFRRQPRSVKAVSLYSVVSRGVVGRFGQRPIDGDVDADVARGRVETDVPGVRFPGASMRVLETGMALIAIATAILIGAGR